jgi:opacity protein-like surface antigen
MRKCIVIAAVVLAVFIVSATAVFAQYAYFGLKGGLSVGMFWGDDADADVFWYAGSSKSPRIGFIGGGYSTIVLAKMFAIQPELLFVMAGQGYDYESGGEFDYITLKPNYIQIPVLFKFYVPMPGMVKVNLFAGPYGAINISDKYFNEWDIAPFIPGSFEGDISDDLTWLGSPVDVRRFDYGATAGVGVDFIVAGLQLNVDARYSLGLANVIVPENVDEPNIKNGVFAVMVGVGF